MSTLFKFIVAVVIGAAVSGLVVFTAVLLSSPLLGQLGAMTPAALAGIAGVVFSWSLDRIGPLRDWFNNLTGDGKRNVVHGGIVGSALALFGLSCANALGVEVGIECSTSGAISLAYMAYFALVGSQANYVINVEPRKRGAH